MGADGNFSRNGHRKRQRVLRRIRNEFREASFKDVQAIDFRQVAAVTGLDEMFEPRRIDIAEYRIPIHEFGDVGDRHAEMLSNGAEGRIDCLPRGLRVLVQYGCGE